ncbi:hypothetical protein L286_23200 [Sphingobium sp. HDIP04]|nr:hypothetical protein L286_23200 [Sphingobium sp. HDIP04]
MHGRRINPFTTKLANKQAVEVAKDCSGIAYVGKCDGPVLKKTDILQMANDQLAFANDFLPDRFD